MSRALVLPLILLTCAAAAGTASAKPFVVTTAGNSPSVAVDLQATTHIVWDSVSADQTSTTHYCRVARNGQACAPGSERTFAAFPEDQDFGGPRVFLTGPRDVLVVTARCCTLVDRAPGESWSNRLYAYRSSDGGATFGEPVWIGTQAPDVGAAFGSGTFYAFGIAAEGTGLQAASLSGFAGAPNVVTSELADSGGVGVSPKGNLVAYANKRGRVLAGALRGDPNSATIAFKKVGTGSGVVVASGPKGADLLYKTRGKRARYITQRFAAGKLGRVSSVSEAGFPIFGTAFQDATGRLHTAWQGDNGLTYRRSARNGRNFSKMKSLSRRFAFYNLAVAANPKGKATVVYDSNKENGRVGGFTAG